MELDSEQRPWGSWHVIDVNAGYKIKRIHVNPGCRLSYQTHAHRSEHWVVVEGTATCTLDDQIVVAGPGESVDVARGAKHRLANEGDVELVIIEVQRGAYTGEDDITRLDDDYGRSGQGPRRQPRAGSSVTRVVAVAPEPSASASETRTDSDSGR